MKVIHRAIIEKARSLSPQPLTALDIGCGNGAFTRLVSGSLPGTAVTAVDIDVSRVTDAGGIAFVKGSAENLPFSSEAFDVIIAAQTLHHWNDKQRGICEAYRVLKKGGSIIIGDPLLEDWLRSSFWGGLIQAVDRGSFTDRKRLTGYLEKAGFGDISISAVSGTMKSVYLITASKGWATTD